MRLVVRVQLVAVALTTTAAPRSTTGRLLRVRLRIPKEATTALNLRQRLQNGPRRRSQRFGSKKLAKLS
eukprot:3371131-Pyramimonas_sp.AAC.1